MKPLSQLVRPNILALQPYSTARDEYAGGGIDVWLDANESPYDNGVNRYPDPHQRALKALIAELKDVDAGRIFLGNGSDEAIDLAFRIFCRPGLDNAVSIAPTYGMYRVAAATNDVQMREVPLGAGYSLPVGALLGRWAVGPRMNIYTNAGDGIVGLGGFARYSFTDNWRIEPSLMALLHNGCSIDMSCDVQYVFHITGEWDLYPAVGITANDIGEWAAGLNIGGGFNYAVARDWDISAGLKWQPMFDDWRKNPVVISIGASYRF